jgi:hypothetical protein
MFRRAPWAWLPALAAVWLSAAAPALAAEGPPVTDAAGLFTPSAVQKAAEEIQGIQRAEHKDLVIETFKGVPEDRSKAFRGMSRRARDDFFFQWAADRARERHVDGVYVLICKSPAHAVAVRGPDTEERVFPDRDLDRLGDELAPGGWRRNHDRDLLRAVAWFHTALHRNLRAGGPEDPTRVWPGALAVIAALLLVWGALALALQAVRRLPHADPADTADPVAARTGEGLTPEPAALGGDGRNDLERRAEDL